MMSFSPVQWFSAACEHYTGVPRLLLRYDAKALRECYLTARLFCESAADVGMHPALADHYRLAQRCLRVLEDLQTQPLTDQRLTGAYTALGWIAEWARQAQRLRETLAQRQPTIKLS